MNEYEKNFDRYGNPKSITVTGIERPEIMPNPSCCAHPGVMCAKCAAKVLNCVVGNAESDHAPHDALPTFPTVDYDSPLNRPVPSPSSYSPQEPPVPSIADAVFDPFGVMRSGQQ